MNILILANSSVGIYKFRKELIEELEKKHDVYVDIPDDEYRGEIRDLGCKVNKNPYLERRGTNPFQDIRLLNYYRSMIRHLNPDVVLTFTIKPNVYGGIACGELDTPYIVDVTGLGTAIEDGGLLRWLTLKLYRMGLKSANKVFFENKDNCDYMLRNRVVKKDRVEVLPGAGVNTEVYSYNAYPSDDNYIIFSTIGRIMKDKGIDELLDAAKIVKKKHPNTEFRLIGDFEEGYEDKVRFFEKQKYIIHMDFQKDIRKLISESHAVIHASYHEGMSNVMQEAASSGRPVIATDVPGCKEIYDNEITGIGFHAKDVQSLVSAIERFIKLPYKKKVAMGKAGREKMVQVFDRSIVVNRYIDVIEHIKA